MNYKRPDKLVVVKFYVGHMVRATNMSNGELKVDLTGLDELDISDGPVESTRLDASTDRTTASTETQREFRKSVRISEPSDQEEVVIPSGEQDYLGLITGR